MKKLVIILSCIVLLILIGLVVIRLHIDAALEHSVMSNQESSQSLVTNPSAIDEPEDVSDMELSFLLCPPGGGYSYYIKLDDSALVYSVLDGYVIESRGEDGDTVEKRLVKHKTYHSETVLLTDSELAEIILKIEELSDSESIEYELVLDAWEFIMWYDNTAYWTYPGLIQSQTFQYIYDMIEKYAPFEIVVDEKYIYENYIPEDERNPYEFELPPGNSSSN